MKRAVSLRIIVCLLLLAAFSGKSMAAKVGMQGGFSIGFGLPTGMFKENINKTFFSPVFSLDYSLKLGKLPVYAGLRGRFATYGHDSRFQEVFVPEFGNFEIEVNHGSQMIEGDLFLRWQMMSRNFLQPYLEFSAGINHLYTRSSIPGGTDSDGDSVDLIGSTHCSDTIFNAKIGGGILIFTGRSRCEDSSRKGLHFIDLGAFFHHGNTATYMAEGSVAVNGDNVEFITYTSPVRFFSVHIGYTFRYH